MQSEAGLKSEWFKVCQKEVISSYFDTAYRQRKGRDPNSTRLGSSGVAAVEADNKFLLRFFPCEVS